MKYEQILEHFDGFYPACHALSVSHATLRKWQHTGVPTLYQLALEVTTDAKLVADFDIENVWEALRKEKIKK